MNTIHSRLKAAREKKELSMEALAKLVGVKAWQTVQQWENGSTAPSRKRLLQVASILGVSTEYLMFGADSSDEQTCEVQMVDAKASAGTGTLVFSEDRSSSILFRKDFLASRGAKPDSVIAFPVSGHSMQDAHILDKSVVAANTSQTEPISKRIYILRIDKKLYVKQLIKKDGLWFARSLNQENAKEYPDIQIDIDDRIVGRVFWCGFNI